MTMMMFLVLLVLMCLITTVNAGDSSDGKCTTGSSYYCPNCGGYEVEDCFDCHGYLSTDTKHNICFDRRLFQSYNDDPTDPDHHYHYLHLDLLGMVVWFFTAGVATACGVGGGGIYVPLGILLFAFAPKQASGLSQASIFGASLGGLILNIRNQHPVSKIRNDPGTLEESGRRSIHGPIEDDTDDDKEQDPFDTATYYTRPLINYDMALFLSPMEMAGAVLGVLIQKILPNWLYLLIAALVLAATAKKTYQKYFATHKAEKEKAAEKHKRRMEELERKSTATSSNMDDVSTVKVTALPPQDPLVVEEEQQKTSEEQDKYYAISSEELQVDTDTARQLRLQYLEHDMIQYPKDKLTALFILWVGLVLLTFLKGGKGVDSIVGITCESPWYSVLIVAQFIWLFGFALVYGFMLNKKQQDRVKVQYPYLEDDPIWDKQSLPFYGGFTFFAGIVAGLIGIGGGMVLGPMMLLMGIHPRVSSATTATMVVLTSSSVAVMFVTSGLVPWSYAVFYFCVCLIGAYVGKSKIDAYIKKSGRSSLLVFILATIIALATVGCIVILLTRLAAKDWCLDGFNHFCTVTKKDGSSCPSDIVVSNRFLMMDHDEHIPSFLTIQT